MPLRFLFRLLSVSAILVVPALPALAASCGTGSFQAWLDDFKTEAAAKGSFGFKPFHRSLTKNR